jgi:rhodanese-related sulfurtransferase
MFKTISVQDVKAKLDANEKVNLVDVREPHEHAEFNIGGTLLPLGKVQTMQIDDIEDLRNEEVIVYCRSGMRSAQATMILQQLGFTNVLNLEGGMVGWKDAIK